MTFCIIHVHCILAPKLNWNQPNLGRMCWIPGKTDRKNAWATVGVASVITLAHSHISRSDLGMISVKGYVHGDANILLCSLKHWLPMYHQELPELLDIEFEAILPGRKQHNPRVPERGAARAGAIKKCTDSRSWSRMLAIACYPFSQALELEIHASNEFIISNQHQTAVSSFWVLISGVQYCVIRSSSVCFVWQNRSRTSPVPIF